MIKIMKNNDNTVFYHTPYFFLLHNFVIFSMAVFYTTTTCIENIHVFQAIQAKK